MPFEIIRNDIVKMQVDAIVNTANPRPVIGSGVDAAVHAKAGPLLLTARKLIGTINTGEARITLGFGLPCKHVIHTVGPVWEDGDHGEVCLLRQCYENSLKLALRHKCRSVAFPLISSGNYGFPQRLALEIAVESIREFLEEHEMQIYLVVFSRASLELSGGLVEQVRSFIDDAYTQEREKAEYSFSVSSRFAFVQEQLETPKADVIEQKTYPSPMECSEVPPECQLMEDGMPGDAFLSEFSWDNSSLEIQEHEEARRPVILEMHPERENAEREKMASTAPLPKLDLPQSCETKVDYPSDAGPKTRKSSGKQSRFGSGKPKRTGAMPVFDEDELVRIVREADAGFSETLLRLIDKSGEKDSDVYKRANVDRKLFSKIRNNPQYKPSKATAVAFAIALRMDLEETRDFISRAGYALSRSSTFDIIIEYFITHERYDIYEINLMLFKFDQSLLGA